MQTQICHPSNHINSIYNIPPGVATINDSAFTHCTNLVSITIPSSVTSIGESAFFFSCLQLQSIIILSGVTIIREGTFYFCKNLQYIKIPSSVTSIGEDV